MMSTKWHLTFFNIILACSILLAPVDSYDCAQLDPSDPGDRHCPPYDGTPIAPPKCFVQKFSVSAFIQCALSSDVKDPDAPRFSISQGGERQSVGVLELLTETLLKPNCKTCPLAALITKTADDYGEGIRKGPFARYLCNRIHPTDRGLCCLRHCLQGVLQEHSVEAFCSGGGSDLMNAPLLRNCVSKVRTDTTTGGEDDLPAQEDTSNDDDDDDDDSDTSTQSSTELIKPATTSSPTSTPSPTPATNTADTSPPPQAAQGTSNTGADSGRRVTYIDRAKRLIFAVLPIIAVL